jgi:hypothetical protein
MKGQPVQRIIANQVAENGNTEGKAKRTAY